MPALKQKTGIIKSKVPPPVPPRGSPRDRRSGGGSSNNNGNTHQNKSGLSPRGTPPSSGSVNYLNDKYFDVVRPNPNANLITACPGPDANNKSYSKANSPIPIRSTVVNEQIFPTDLILRPVFGERRSPNCVQDWLEVNGEMNDFGSSDFDRKIIEWSKRGKHALMARKPLPIKTAILQREDSFKNISHSSGSVKSLTLNYETKIAEAAATPSGVGANSSTKPTDSNSSQAPKQNSAKRAQAPPVPSFKVVIKPRVKRRGAKVQMSRLNWMPGSSELDDEFCTSSRCRRNVVFDASSHRRDMSPMPDFIKRESLYDDYREAELIFNTLQPARGRHGFESTSSDNAKPMKFIEALSNMDVNDNFSSQCLESFSAEQFV